MPMAAKALTELLDASGVSYELLPHAHTERAAEEAVALGVPPESVAKTLVLTMPDGYVRTVLSAADRLDLHKVREVLEAGSKKVHLASEDELERDFPEFELGAVPPVGGRKDPVLVDQRISELEEIVFEAGDHDESVRLRAGDLQRLADVRIVDIRED
jgi:Ala-tRNA(Pro) deacylase